MAAEDLALLEEWIEALNRWDTEWVLSHVADDVHWEPLRAKTEGAFQGKDGIRRFIADTEESFDLFQGHIAEIRDLEDGRVLTTGTVRIRGKGSGIETEVPTAAIVTFRDGLLVHYRDYGDRQEALEAAGLA